jgi:hypothetical protein
VERRASFEHARTLEDFDFHFNGSVPKSRVVDLATCAFVSCHQNGRHGLSWKFSTLLI